MKWYEFFTITSVAALTVFGAYAQHITGFTHPWARAVFMFLTGVAFLTSEWMIAEEDCRGEMGADG